VTGGRTEGPSGRDQGGRPEGGRRFRKSSDSGSNPFGSEVFFSSRREDHEARDSPKKKKSTPTISLDSVSETSSSEIFGVRGSSSLDSEGG
jgi:hypothetical protein